MWHALRNEGKERLSGDTSGENSVHERSPRLPGLICFRGITIGDRVFKRSAQKLAKLVLHPAFVGGGLFRDMWLALFRKSIATKASGLHLALKKVGQMVFHWLAASSVRRLGRPRASGYFSACRKTLSMYVVPRFSSVIKVVETGLRNRHDFLELRSGVEVGYTLFLTRLRSVMFPR